MAEDKKGITRRELLRTLVAATAAGVVTSNLTPLGYGVKKAWAGETLKIGFMAPFTGPASRTGDMHRKGIMMALEDARAAGEIPVKVNGKKYDIEPLWVDSQSSPEEAVKAVTYALNRGAKMMVTGWHSSVAMAVMDAEAPYHIVHLCHGGESQSINFKINNAPHKYRGWFKGWPPPPIYAGLYGDPLKYFIEKGLWKPKNRKAAVLAEDTDYGRGWGEALKVSLRTIGFDVVLSDVNDIQQTDFTPLITKYKSAGVSIVAATETAGVPTYNYVKQSRALGLKALQILHGLTWTAEWYQNTGSASNYILSMDSPYPVNDEQFKWLKRFKDKYGIEASIAPSGDPYDHTRLAVHILNKFGSLDFDPLVHFIREKVKYKGVWQFYNFSDYNDFWSDFSTQDTLHELSRNDVRTGEFLKTGFFMPMAQMFDGKPKVIYPPNMAASQFKAPPWI